MDDRLAMQARAGDAEAFDALVRRYEDRLLGFAYRMLHDMSDAQDVLQQTFLRAYRGLASYRPGGQFASWLYRIALNECRRRIGARRRQPTAPEEAAAYAHSDRSSDPEAQTIQNDRNRAIREAVMKLPDHYREAILLFYFEELSVAEMARAMGVSVTAAKVRLHRARAKLSNALKGEQ